jgi:hypothetical protein
MGLNQGLHSEKPATNYLRYVTATVKVVVDSGQCMQKKKTLAAFTHTGKRRQFIIHPEL